MTVYALGERHYPKGTDLTYGTYLVGAGFIDSAAHYEKANLQQRLFEDVPDSSGTRREFMRDRVSANLQAGFESDERFVRLQRPPFLACLAWRLEAGNRMEPCTDRVAADLFGADWRKKERPNIESKQLPGQYIEQLPSFCRSQILQRTKSQWADGLNEVCEAFTERQEVIRIETEDRIWVLRAAIEEIEAEIHDRESNPTEANRQAVATNYRPRIAQLREEILLTERSRDLRLDILARSLEHLREPNQNNVQLQCTAVIEMQNDPVPMPEEEADDESGGSESPATATIDSPSHAPGVTPKQLPNRPR